MEYHLYIEDYGTLLMSQQLAESISNVGNGMDIEVIISNDVHVTLFVKEDTEDFRTEEKEDLIACGTCTLPGRRNCNWILYAPGSNNIKEWCKSDCATCLGCASNQLPYRR